MALTWSLLSLVLLVMLALLSVTAYRRRQRSHWPAWDIAFQADPAAHAPHQDLETALGNEFGGLVDTLQLARLRHDRGDVDDAVSVLRIAAQHVARYVPSLRERLWVWREVARAVAALYPLPSLRVWHFEGWRLRGVAVGEAALRPWVSAVGAFALRVRLLAYGFGLVLGGFRTALRAIDSERSDFKKGFERMTTLGSDLGALQAASLDAYKALLISIKHRTAGAAHRPLA